MNKNTCLSKFFLFTLLALFIACNPAEDNSYTLGGQTVELPSDWTVSVNDFNNEVIIEYTPLGNFIDGTNVLAVQFNCPEAGISAFVKKDDPVAPISVKVYRSGNYKLYVAAVTRAGVGVPKELPFTVEKNLLLEILDNATMTEVVEFNIDDNGSYKETFYKSEVYIESGSFITLAGALASDEVIVNLDFFSRENTNTVRFLGQDGVYNVYWNPVRKNVIIEPTVPISAANGYYVLTGVLTGYPTTISSDDIKAAYGDGDGRYTTYWDPGASIRSRIVMREIGTDTYQATICIGEGAAFKPFSNTGWGDDVYGAANCTFSGSDILKPIGDWSPNENCDFNGYYRFTLNAAQKTVNIKKVSATGEELPDDSGGGEEPPIVVDDPTTINLATFENKTVNGQAMGVFTKELEQAATYSVAGNFDDADVLFNVDFFERTSAGSVRFLGETGEYTLYHYKGKKILLIAPATPAYPDYIMATGKGFGYPVKTGTPTYISSYPQNAAAGDILQYILFRKTGEKTYQATIMLRSGSGNVEFKPYHPAGGGSIINNWGAGGEYNFNNCNVTGEAGIFIDGGGEYHNWVAGANVDTSQPYRITVTVTNDGATKTADATIAKYTLP